MSLAQTAFELSKFGIFLSLFKLAVQHANRPQEIDQSVDRFDGLIVALDDRAGKFIEWGVWICR